MSSRNYTLTFSGAGTLTAPGGRFLYIKAASAELTITARGATTQPIVLEGIGAGTKFGPVPPELKWTYLDVTSAAPQVVTLFISDDAEVDIVSTVNVAGQVATVEMPSVTVATPARIATNTATDTLIAAQNLSRRRITVQNPSSNVDSVTVGPTGSLSTTQGVEIEPGMSFQFVTFAALYARAVTNTPSVQVLEES
jgi:hypothetical protein